jgi:hypothetical protein
MNIIFQINGGIGKCVAATAVCEAIKKKYPNDKLIVVSGYADVFLNNPHVDRAYNYGGMSYFYEEYIEDKDVKIAESPDDARWEGIRERANTGIIENETEIEINKAIIKLAEEKLKEIRKDRGKYIG